MVPPRDFLESLSDSPLVDNCLLDAVDSFIEKLSLQAYLSFETVENITCNGCAVNFARESTGNILYIATNPANRSCLSSLVPLALKDVSILSGCNCPCGFTQKRSEIEVTRVSSFLIVAFKRSLLNLGKDHSRIVTPLSLTILNRSFSLKAVAFHHGLMANNGHYTCLVKAANGWLLCNDEVVSSVSNASEFLAKDDYASSAMFWFYSFDPNGGFNSPRITRA